MKKYICIKGSPEIPKGTLAITSTVLDCNEYTLYTPEQILFKRLPSHLVDQNPECWEEVKEETAIDRIDNYRKNIEDTVQECYLQCLAVECGEGECAKAIATKFPDLVNRVGEEKEKNGRCRLNKGDTYWSIQEGCIVEKTEMKIYNDKWLFEQGNYFYTPQEAEEELMRMKSRAKRWDFVPKDGEWYYMWGLSDEEVYKYKWSITNNDYNQWGMGNCHRTKEDAEKWGETYAQYFLPPQE